MLLLVCPKCSSTQFILLVPLFPSATFLLQLCPPTPLWLGWVLGLMHSWCPRTCLHSLCVLDALPLFSCLMLPFALLCLPFFFLEILESLFLVWVSFYSLCLEHCGPFCIIFLMFPLLCFPLFSLNGACLISGWISQTNSLIFLLISYFPFLCVFFNFGRFPWLRWYCKLYWVFFFLLSYLFKNFQ